MHGLRAVGVPAQRGGGAPVSAPVAANEVLTVWLMAMLGLGVVVALEAVQSIELPR